MSKQGCLNRIAIYKKHENFKMLEEEEKYFKENYSTPEPKVEQTPKKENIKKSK